MSFQTVQDPIVCAAGDPTGGDSKAPEEERTRGHGHGISRNRAPADGRGLPHDSEREHKQPYARELDDYSGAAGHAPDEQTGDEP